MKQCCLSLAFTLLSILALNAQRVIENPIVAADLGNNSTIEKIELTETATVLYFRTSLYPGLWFTVSDSAYIQPVGSNNRLYLKGSKGIAVEIGQKWVIPDSGSVNYALIFPPLDSNIKKIDFIGNDNIKWKILGIAFTSKKTTFPEALMGNWMQDEKWLVGLYDSVAIYDNKIWHYSKISHQKDNWEVVLNDNTTQATLYIHAGSKGHCFIGTNPLKQIDCSNSMPNYISYRSTEPDKNFDPQLFKQGYATIKGYIKTYAPLNESSVENSSIYCNYYIQYKSGAKINADGSFELKVPLMHPTHLALYFNYGTNNHLSRFVFVEPGKELVCYFDDHFSTVINPHAEHFVPGALFMGDDASVNNELIVFENRWRKINPGKFGDSLLHTTQDRYKQLCIADKKASDEQILTLVSTNSISPQTAKILHVENNLSLCNYLLEYNILRELAYKNEKNIVNSQKKYVAKVTLGFPYLDVVESTLKDNFCVVSHMLSGTLYHIQLLDEVKKPDTKLTNIMRLMVESGTVLNDEERTLYKSLSSLDKEESNMSDSFEYLEKLTLNFKKKYSNTIDRLANELQTMTPNAYLQRYFGLTPLITDIITTKEYVSKINLTNNNLTAFDLKSIRKTINNPVFADYLETINKDIKQLEKNDGSVMKGEPDLPSDNMLEVLLQPYRGKVVLIDFWETWCIPCQMGLSQLAPLKEQLKDSNIVFVCITTPNSPKDIWKTKAKTIRGEHYRLTQAQHSYFYNQYKLNSVPRYMLVDKNGAVVNYNLGHKSNTELKELLLEYCNR